MERHTLIIFALVLMVSFGSAFELTQNTKNPTIIPDFDQATKINFSVRDLSPNYYTIYTLSSVKIPLTKPIYLDKNEAEISIEVYPTSNLFAQNTAQYVFSVFIIDTSKQQEYSEKLTIRVVKAEDALFISSDSNNPDSKQISFFIENKEKIDLKNISANFNSIFFNEEKVFDVDANSKTKITIDVPSDKLEKIEAGSYLVSATIKTDRGEKTISGKILLEEKRKIEEKRAKSGWIVITNDISKKNYGNVVENVSIEIKKDLFSRLFSSFSSEPSSVERKGVWIIYSWKKQVGASEELHIESKTNYLIPILLIIAICIIYIGARRYIESKIQLVKTATPVKTSSGQFALKVKIEVVAKKSISNVSVIDKVPKILQIYDKFTAGIKPVRVDINNKRIQWDLGDMNEGEKRILTYIVYSTIGVVGKFALPQAMSVFEKNGNIKEANSNFVYFLAEQKSSD